MDEPYTPKRYEVRNFRNAQKLAADLPMDIYWTNDRENATRWIASVESQGHLCRLLDHDDGGRLLYETGKPA